MPFTKEKSESLRSLSSEWGQGKFRPVYFFAGPDSLQKDEALKLLQKKFLGDNESNLNIDRFDGETSDVSEVINSAQTLPFLSGNRLIVVRRVEEFSATEKNRLADSLSRVPSGNCLVLLSNEKADARSSLVQKTKELGAMLIFWIPFEDQLPGWVIERVETLGKNINFQNAKALLEIVGPNLADMAQEIDKALLYIKDRKEILLEDVQAVSSGNRTLQFLEFDRALWQKNQQKVLELIQVMEDQGQVQEQMMAQLVRCYQKLLMGKAFFAEKRQSELWNRIWIRSRQVQQEFQQAVRAHSWEQLLKILEDLLQAERDMKIGQFKAPVGFTLLISKILNR